MQRRLACLYMLIGQSKHLMAVIMHEPMYTPAHQQQQHSRL
jgi:hypothetical protein